MQVFSNFRRIATIAAVATVVFLASCANGGTQKYGCPNHLHINIGSFIR
ncbi:MAG: hypothetical protein JSS96_00650 [Bacteroidetes bacterium]|nr:hypothetical protein [Bacteroidota bacterium]